MVTERDSVRVLSQCSRHVFPSQQERLFKCTEEETSFRSFSVLPLMQQSVESTAGKPLPPSAA